MKIRASIVSVLLLASLAVAQDKVPANVVRVIGSAEVKVVPDKAVIEVGVEKQNASATTAKQSADTTSRHIIGALRANGVDARDIQTAYLSLQPQSYTRKGVRISYFVAAQTLAVTVRDLAKLDSLLESLVRAGGNRIDSISYETTNLRKYRDQARDLAVKAAREKADALAGALGQQIGKAEMIDEVPEYSDVIRGGLFGNAFASKVRTREEATSPGEQTISASVVVSFQLM